MNLTNNWLFLLMMVNLAAEFSYDKCKSILNILIEHTISDRKNFTEIYLSLVSWPLQCLHLNLTACIFSTADFKKHLNSLTLLLSSVYIHTV